MVFSSLVFVFVFLPITILLYFLSPRFLKNPVLLLASLIFYAWGEPIYFFIMIFSSVYDYMNGIVIDKYRSHKTIPKLVLIFSLVVNLGILGFFKYYGFMVDNINSLFNLDIAKTNLPLPVGISFYTFQTLSYTIDVYLGKVPVQKNIVSFGTYITMFPQLVAGPIVKYGDIALQMNKRNESIDMFGEGAAIFITGLGKKVLLANNIGLLWHTVKAIPTQELSVLSAWLGIIAFTFQIYFDFSGYSDMAIGLGKMFGFELLKNFDYSYISKSVTEFWRRWHISLGSWFREYVYIPLGGNRVSKLKQYRNLFIVWFLTGFWHGANWNFILWGLYFGVLVTVEKIFLKKWLESRPVVIGHAYTLLAVIIGWVFFELENLSTGFRYIGIMFGFGGRPIVDGSSLYYLYTNALLFLVLAVCSTPVPGNILIGIRRRMKLTGTMAVSACFILIAVLCTAFLVNETYNPFLYFRF